MESDTVLLSYDIFENADTSSSANPIILIHGLTWNKFIFRELANRLCSSTKRKVITLDLRNHGESPSTTDCNLSLMVKDVRRFMTDNELEQAAFVCHSFSSTIAYLIAYEKPQCVECIVMIDHPPFADFTEEFIETNVLPQIKSQERFLKSLDSSSSLEKARNKILSLASSGTIAQQYFIRKLAYDLDKDDEGFKWKLDLGILKKNYLAGDFTVKPRGPITQRILIIRCKSSSTVLNSKFNDVVRHNPNVNLETIEDTTHLLMFEKPDIFVKLVVDFLK